MAYEAVTGKSLPTEGLLFDGDVYDLGWDGQRGPPVPESPRQAALDPSALPSQDFAAHLINTVRFRCGELYYLFDETRFMGQFARFHESAGAAADASPLWYVHYLMVLAFGKAFVVQASRSPRPPGADLFVQAMKLLPDFTFMRCDPVEKLQVLCCAALYLQCVQCRPAAHRMVKLPTGLYQLVFQGHDANPPSLKDKPGSERGSRVWNAYGDEEPFAG